uniref:phycytochrome bilisome rod-core linker protein n=1 Tax=Glaucosphaera vacuolata TaxID=38265 RepID=UPI001FCE0B6E|nr:phycytochrome bilisome rod-core linker protein [Glaucosphaera vacuolata]UNJ18679.1 phycytochrome bilisome rod-core linker protein [Glaucosphaera vacuolata]
MSIIIFLNYSFSCQNQRVASFEVVKTASTNIYTTETLPYKLDIEATIWAAYRQIFSEHQILRFTKQTALESALRFQQITVKDFIRGLLLSNTFRNLNYDVNNNYRFVELCVQRVLGRDLYSEREKIAWSIVIANKGIEGFVDSLLNSDEYLENFGDFRVPFQRRRILYQRTKGETPFNLKTPRYGKEFLGKLTVGTPQYIWQGTIRKFTPQERIPKAGDPALFLRMVRESHIYS